MIGTQFFSKLSHPSHPKNHLTLPPPSARKMKITPSYHFQSLISQFAQPPSNDPNLTSHTIHTNYAHHTINSLSPNKVLNHAPPAISSTESSLPRRIRTYLSQLRSNYSPLLRDYQHRINISPTDQCRFCSSSPETVNHIFKTCPSLTQLRHQHQITPFSLWRAPERVVAFLEASGVL